MSQSNQNQLSLSLAHTHNSLYLYSIQVKYRHTRTRPLTMPFVQELIAIALQPTCSVIVKFACNPTRIFVSPLLYITDALYGVLIHNGSIILHSIDDVSAMTAAVPYNATIIAKALIRRVKEANRRGIMVVYEDRRYCCNVQL
jgi:hypothetical protein